MGADLFYTLSAVPSRFHPSADAGLDCGDKAIAACQLAALYSQS